MSQTSPILALPFLQASQAQKHVTHNEALRALDVLVQLSVQAFELNTPPGLPQEGDVYAIGDTGTDAWAGHDLEIAAWIDGAWYFFVPLAGWRAWGVAENELRIWDGTGWVLPTASTENVDSIGVGTSADPTNKLAVRSDASLLTHDGAGHQLKINKSGTGDTASLLFQNGFSGRAEMGLAGEDNFSFKVSDDGANWTTAIDIAADTGTISLGEGLTLGGNKLGGLEVTIDDDDVAALTPPRRGGFALITCNGDDSWPQPSESGLIFFDAGNSLAIEKHTGFGGVGANLDVTSSNVNGTTGTDGNVTIAVRSDALKIENRSGSTRAFSVSFL